MNSKQKSGWIKIALVVVIAAAAVYGYRTWSGGKAVQQQTAQAAEPLVIVKPVEKADSSSQPSEYVGRVEAIQTVQVKPQISGEIAKVSFKEGSIVKAGQLLFQIDPAQYQATVALRKAELEKAEATLAEAEKYHKRVMAANDQAVSAADRDTAESSVLQGKAAVSQAKANLRLAEINLGYCRITAPITGKIGIANLTKGNYVTPSSGALATIVQMDPVRVSYTLPDRDYLDQLELFKKEGSVYKTKLILSNGSELDVPGQRDFEDNTVDQMTGTVMMRLRYTNDSGMLIPGEMVRVFTQPVKSRIVNVIPQTAVMADAEGDYVYVVEADNSVRDVRVKLGREMGTLREVVSGLKDGQNVVVAGLQNLRPGTKVRIDTSASANEATSNSVLDETSGAEIINSGDTGTKEEN
ncbi:efflux RND transporter periplasmic adaptor subunit [Cloacibacillus evryensis]|uniref:efflux RND transporter periplasmic adaptor subunit n=1 Tax=Cloacibacillus evryensis TaxID=508460 RepID=UPI00210BB3C6|nr:efflux RND transporter periplasmic adaptor subunit [Cloacibacillus evryensis]MCQ4762668.1 efflux RND transporter periplasmic adaptor subunit [Cloacibacillus evryensis]MEA5035594.1 efflux RND transporter periplasmic adaptor subunit [Cloacibacillus evryensis]